MKKLDQKGFTGFEIALLVLVLAALGFAGYTVYQKNKPTDTNTTIVTTKKDEADPAQSKPAIKNLEIPELGIKMQLTETIQNAYYLKKGEYYYFSIKDFDTKSGFSGCKVTTGESGGYGVVGLITAKLGEPKYVPLDDQTWTQADLDNSGLTKAGDTYYGFSKGNGGPCYDDNTEGSELLNAVIAAFVAQSKTFTKL